MTSNDSWTRKVRAIMPEAKELLERARTNKDLETEQLKTLQRVVEVVEKFEMEEELSINRDKEGSSDLPDSGGVGSSSSKKRQQISDSSVEEREKKRLK